MKFYGYKRCGTSRKAEKFLESRNIDYEFIDITLNPPSVEELSEIIKQSGKDIKKFFNTSGIAYKEGKVKDILPNITDLEKIEMLSGNGKLIKRPVVTNGSKSSVAFKEDEFTAIWG